MDSERTNATPEQPAKRPGGVTGKGFVKGDPRINRKGRPKSFDALRELAQQIAHEPAPSKDGGSVVIGDHVATQAEMILRQMARDNPERFIEIAFGKVPTPIALEGGGEPIIVQVVYDDDPASNSPAPAPASGSDDNPEAGEEI